MLVSLFTIQCSLRISLDAESSPPTTELLEPLNLVLTVKRNLAAAWYPKMAAIEIDGDLKPMKVRVCGLSFIIHSFSPVINKGMCKS